MMKENKHTIHFKDQRPSMALSMSLQVYLITFKVNTNVNGS